MKAKYTEPFEEQGVLKVIKDAEVDYNSDVNITPHWSWNMADNIELITLYLHSKFLSGDEDSLGYKRYFKSISRPMCDNATKNIDVSTKDINIKARDVKNDRIKSLVLNDQLRQFMDKNYWGTLLNRISLTAPRYGSVIITKNEQNEIEFKELNELEFSPSLKNSVNNHDLKTNYLIMPTYLNISDLLKLKKPSWNQKAIDNIIERYYSFKNKVGMDGISDIRVVTSYIYCKNSLFTKNTPGYDYYKVYATLDSRYNTNTLDHNNFGLDKVLYWKKGVEPKSKKWDFIPVINRNQGEGFMEMTFDNQELENEQVNAEQASMRSMSKTVYKTNSPTMLSNILTDTDNGDIIDTTDGDITQLDTTKKDISNYAAQESSNIANLRLVTNGSEITTGEGLPSRTPYRLGALLEQGATKFFTYTRERLGLFLSEVVQEFVIPELIKDLASKDTLYVDDIDVWEELFSNKIEEELRIWMIRQLTQKGISPSDKELLAKRETITNKYKNSSRFIKNVKKDWTNFKFDVYTDVTGEQNDTNQKVESLINLMNQIASNPAILENPITLSMMESIAEFIGIDKRTFNANIGSAASSRIAATKNSGGGNAVVPESRELARNTSMAPGGAESNVALQNNQQ